MRLSAIAAAAVAIAVAGSASSAGAPGASWTSFGNGPAITAFTPAPAFTSKVRHFRLEWQATVDGGVVASPLAAPVHGQGLVTFVATEAGSVYALKPGGGVLWERSFGSVDADGACGTYGISSTGVVDQKRGLFYIANADGMLHALRLADGAEAPGWPVQVTVRPRTEYVWGGLRLAGSRLYVPVASYCDVPDSNGVAAEGRLLAYDVDRLAEPPAVFDPVPGPNNLGGIWGWGGVAVSANGKSVYTGVGDAEPDVDTGYSNSMVELTPDLSRVVAAARSPGSQPGGDTDIGAAPVLFHPKGCPALLAANSKAGELLVWRQDRLARGAYLRIPLSDGVSAFVGAPSWSPRTQMLYVASATAERAGERFVGTMALAVTPKCGFTKRWFVATGRGSQPEPLVVGDLVGSTGGFAGGFVVSRARSGVVVWRYATTSATLAPLIAAGGLLIGGDTGGHVYAFRPVSNGSKAWWRRGSLSRISR